MEFMGITSVAAITSVCYLIALMLRQTPIDNKWLPTVCGICGGILGVVSHYTMADFPAGDLLTAIAIGIASGLAATGAHQACKQLTSGEDAE